ncbi:gamma-glutamyl-gamma-aminobutyrate hydrolase family protein [Neobacillus niacini]|uniref:gamma-glutamyl-gamma-aminobutyrate hydrolase family protein n=1 Tax=Neobacillus niacini TaxID=86668 RepID=UPI0028559A5A|nr:gamma-glutamyl-gamma-aminobutyrate hydrolase family protein [Neobacillus niacini]MDR6997709.1 putative glutamine amidotransferase [Neobacillus niacini]
MEKPIIGITTSYVKYNDNMEGVYIHHDYHRAVERAGGIPFLLPVVKDEEAVKQYAALCDGIIFSGGEDIDPHFYGKPPHVKIGFFRTERDEFEIKLFDYYLKTKKPIFGICRGLQIINVACGGTLIQDIPSLKEKEVHLHEQTIPRHLPFHRVKLKKNSWMEGIWGKEDMQVNSLHHQAIEELGEGLAITALADDGIIEAVEGMGHPYLIAVQWHPESMSEKHPEMQELFNQLVEASKNPFNNGLETVS